MEIAKASVISSPSLRIQRIKGEEPIVYQPDSFEARDYFATILKKKKSLNNHYNIKYPGIISKRRYSKLGEKDRKDCETFRKLFGSCKSIFDIKKVLTKINQEAGFLTENGLFVYPTDYVNRSPSVIDLPVQEYSDFGVHNQNKPNKSLKSDCRPTTCSISLLQKHNRSNSPPTQETVRSESFNINLLQMLKEKDLKIDILVKEVGRLTDVCSELISSRNELKEENIQLGKRVNAMESEYQLKSKQFECDRKKYEISNGLFVEKMNVMKKRLIKYDKEAEKYKGDTSNRIYQK